MIICRSVYVLGSTIIEKSTCFLSVEDHRFQRIFHDVDQEIILIISLFNLRNERDGGVINHLNPYAMGYLTRHIYNLISHKFARYFEGWIATMWGLKIRLSCIIESLPLLLHLHLQRALLHACYWFGEFSPITKAFWGDNQNIGPITLF